MACSKIQKSENEKHRRHNRVYVNYLNPTGPARNCFIV